MTEAEDAAASRVQQSAREIELDSYRRIRAEANNPEHVKRHRANLLKWYRRIQVEAGDDE